MISVEKGAPTFKERLEMIKVIKKVTGKRIIVRVQPYILDVKDDVLKAIEIYSDIGVHGIILEGMKYKKTVPGFIKVAGDFCYPSDVLLKHFQTIKDKAHSFGLKFYCGENRLRNVGMIFAAAALKTSPTSLGIKLTSIISFLIKKISHTLNEWKRRVVATLLKLLIKLHWPNMYSKIQPTKKLWNL